MSSSIGTLGTTVWVSYEYNAFRTNMTQLDQGEIDLNPSAGAGTGVRLGAPFAGNIDGRITVGATDSFMNTTIPVIENQTYFIVAKIDYLSTGDVISLYVNPTPGVTPTTPTATKTLASTVVLPVSNQVILYSPQTTFTTFDEVRIGISYASVAPDPLIGKKAPKTHPHLATASQLALDSWKEKGKKTSPFSERKLELLDILGGVHGSKKSKHAALAN
jgi:hypothetical protein